MFFSLNGGDIDKELEEDDDLFDGALDIVFRSDSVLEMNE